MVFSDLIRSTHSGNSSAIRWVTQNPRAGWKGKAWGGAKRATAHDLRFVRWNGCRPLRGLSNLWTSLWRSSCLYNENSGRWRCLPFDRLRGSEWHPGRRDWLRSSRAWRSVLPPLFARSILRYAHSACGQSALASSSVHPSLFRFLRSRLFSSLTTARRVPVGIPLITGVFGFAWSRFFGVCWKFSLRCRVSPLFLNRAR